MKQNSKYYPVCFKNKQAVIPKTNYKPKRNNRLVPVNINPTNVFNGNIVDNMNFGHQGDNLSGYVERKVVLIDRQGNKQIATETQFYNSGPNSYVRIKT